MTTSKEKSISVTRYNQTFEFINGAVIVTTRDTGMRPASLAAQRATQLQALLMTIGDAWGDVAEADDELAQGLVTLAADMAGEVAGLSVLADEARTAAKAKSKEVA